MGPTAAGKTWLACELSRRIPVHLISADSVMVYRGMDIGSAKPSVAELSDFPHALIDIRDPADPYSAADFRRDALIEIDLARLQGKLPVIVGGTSLYFRRLVEGMAEVPSSTQESRAAIMEAAEREGWEATYLRLERIDPLASRVIHPNNRQRLIRALEVHALSGRAISDFWSEQSESAPALADGTRLQFTQVGLMPQDRSRLHEQIARRFVAMLAQGLIEEVAALKDRPDLHAELPSMRAVGYAQVWEWLDGNREDHELLRQRGIAATRQLAKRQLTWLRKWPDLMALQADGTEAGRAHLLDNFLNSTRHLLT